MSTILIEAKTRIDDVPLTLDSEIVASFSGLRLLPWICVSVKISYAIIDIKSRTTALPETIHELLSLTGREVEGPGEPTSRVFRILSSSEMLDELEPRVTSLSPTAFYAVQGTRVSAVVYHLCNKLEPSPSPSSFAAHHRRRDP